jgi:hypothetical protein
MPQYSNPALQPIPVDQLETLLDRRAEQQARPRATPRDVVAVWMGNAGAGVGAALLVGVGCSVFGVELWPTAASAAGVALGVVTGAAMLWRGLEDEATARLSNKRVRRTVEHIQHSAAEQVRRRDMQLSAAFDTIEELERTVSQLEHRLNLAHVDLGNARRATQPNNWVRPVEVSAQDEQDARSMIHHRHSMGVHLSRRQAIQNKGWTQERHKAAMRLLEAAGVVRGDSTQPIYLHADKDNLTAYRMADALAALDTYLIHARSKEPPVMPQAAHYVEDYDE